MKRPLPWRETRDPWAIWVSEVMLQQTRVETVRPRFSRFLEAFPDPAALARASEEEVLAHWSGLGYYTRARQLRRAAALVADAHGGRFPDDPVAARKLPGVGAYTAAAILSIAYGRPWAVVDGNVARVLSRVFCLDPPQARPADLTALAQALLAPKRPGDSNQAMMELGAMVCVPREPACAECPVARLCQARQTGRTTAYPAPRRRPPVVELAPNLYLWRDSRGRLLLEKGHWALLPHLWLPPIRREGEPLLPARFTVDPSSLVRLGTVRHSITRHRIELHLFGGAVRVGPGRLPETYRLCDESEIARIGRSSLLEKALRRERERTDARSPARRRS